MTRKLMFLSVNKSFSADVFVNDVFIQIETCVAQIFSVNKQKHADMCAVSDKTVWSKQIILNVIVLFITLFVYIPEILQWYCTGIKIVEIVRIYTRRCNCCLQYRIKIKNNYWCEVILNLSFCLRNVSHFVVY